MSEDGRRLILEALDRFGALVEARDYALLEEFAPDADTRIVGSELRDLAEGREEIEAHLRQVFEAPIHLSFAWESRNVSLVGDVAWLFAAGYAVLRDAEGEIRSPYRLTGVFQRRRGKWLWRHFHGSEPLPGR